MNKVPLQSARPFENSYPLAKETQSILRLLAMGEEEIEYEKYTSSEMVFRNLDTIE